MNGKWKTSVVTAWVPFRCLKHMQKCNFFYFKVSPKSSEFSSIKRVSMGTK